MSLDERRAAYARLTDPRNTLLQSLISLQRPQVIFVVLLSVLMPLSIFVGRRNVSIHRLRMLRNLKHALPVAGERSLLPPGFAMIEVRHLDDAEGQNFWLHMLA